jgi:hypothetical protein
VADLLPAVRKNSGTLRLIIFCLRNTSALFSTLHWCPGLLLNCWCLFNLIQVKPFQNEASEELDVSLLKTYMTTS